MVSEQKAEMWIHKLTDQSLNKCVSWGENTALFQLSIFLLPDRNIPGLIRRALLGSVSDTVTPRFNKHAKKTA
jgi:hypothetical protein